MKEAIKEIQDDGVINPSEGVISKISKALKGDEEALDDLNSEEKSIFDAQLKEIQSEDHVLPGNSKSSSKFARNNRYGVYGDNGY